MKTNSIETFTLVTSVCLTIILVEFLYSLWKKDSIYSLKGTAGNFLDYIVTAFISKVFSKIYFTSFFIIFTLLGYSYGSFNIFSLLACLLIVDFGFYLLHYAKHRVNFLWVFHFVHHSDNRFNMSTFLRASWVEQIFLMSIPFLPPILLGFNPYMVILSSYITFIFQLLVHSQYLRFPSFFSYIFITPGLHKIHHDIKEKHQNTNFGAMFSIWDRMFGTYTAKIDSFSPGIKDYSQDNFIKMQTDPIITYFKKKTL